jgi:ribosomal protein L37E
MTIIILFRNGKELPIKCDSVECERNTITGRVINLQFKGIKENKIVDLDFNEIIAIYRKVSDEFVDTGIGKCEKECRDCGKQKTAHWIDGHCSNCGCDVPAYIIDYKWQKDMDAKYCPNCGHRMVKS